MKPPDLLQQGDIPFSVGVGMLLELGIPVVWLVYSRSDYRGALAYWHQLYQEAEDLWRRQDIVVSEPPEDQRALARDLRADLRSWPGSVFYLRPGREEYEWVFDAGVYFARADDGGFVWYVGGLDRATAAYVPGAVPYGITSATMPVEGGRVLQEAIQRAGTLWLVPAIKPGFRGRVLPAFVPASVAVVESSSDGGA